MDNDAVWPGSYDRGEPGRFKNEKTLLALTLHRPWDWAIYERHKPVENRKWAPPRWIIGRHIALHAGRVWDEPAAEWMRTTFDLVVPRDEELVHSAIVAVARVTGYYEVGLGHPAPPREHWLWAFGPFAWTLDEVVKLPEPVGCRGYQKLWSVGEPMASKVREQWARARRAA